MYYYFVIQSRINNYTMNKSITFKYDSPSYISREEGRDDGWLKLLKKQSKSIML